MPQQQSDWVDVAPPEWAPQEPDSMIGQGLNWWNNQWVNQPVTDAPSRFAKYLNSLDTMKDSDYLAMDEQYPGMGQASAAITSFGKDMVTGAGALGDALATPLNIATLGSGTLESLAAKYGLETVAALAGMSTKALSSLFAGSGAAKTYEGYQHESLPEMGAGIVEMAGGGAGMLHGTRLGGANIPGFLPREAAPVADAAAHIRPPGPYQPPEGGLGLVPPRQPFNLMRNVDPYQGPEVGPYGTSNPNQGQLDLGMGFRVENPTQQSLDLGPNVDINNYRQQQLLDLPPNNDPYHMINQIEGLWPPLDPVRDAHQPSLDFGGGGDGGGGGISQTPYTPPPARPSAGGGFDFGPPDIRQLDLFNQSIPGMEQSPYTPPAPQPIPENIRTNPQTGETVIPGTTNRAEFEAFLRSKGYVYDPATGMLKPPPIAPEAPITPEQPVQQVPDENMVPVGDNPNFNVGVNEQAPGPQGEQPLVVTIHRNDVHGARTLESQGFVRGQEMGSMVEYTKESPPSRTPLPAEQALPPEPTGPMPDPSALSDVVPVFPDQTRYIKWLESQGFVRDPRISPDGMVNMVRQPEAPVTNAPPVAPPVEPPVTEAPPAASNVVTRPAGGWVSRETIARQEAENAARLRGPVEGVTFTKRVSEDGKSTVEIAIVDAPTQDNVAELFKRGFMPVHGKLVEGKALMAKGDFNLLPETITKKSRPQAPPPQDVTLPDGQKLSDSLRNLSKNPLYFDRATGKWTDNARSTIPRDFYKSPETIKWMNLIERESTKTLVPPPRIPPDAHVPGATLPGRVPIDDGTITVPNERLSRPGYRKNLEKNFKEVGPSEDGLGTIFKKFITDEEGGVSHREIFDALTGLLKKKLENPTAEKWQSAVDELDVANAPDEAYRNIVDPNKDVRLKPGDTWRDYVQRGIDFFESKMPQGIKGESGQVGSGQTASGPGIGTRVSDAMGWGSGEPGPPPLKKGEKPFTPVMDFINIARDTSTTFDASIPGRNGLPLITSPRFWDAFGAMVKAGKSLEAFDKIDAKTKSLPIMKDHFNVVTGEVEPAAAKRLGLKQFTIPSRPGPKAEGAMSRLLEKIPILGGGFRVSNRMAVTFLNHLSAHEAQFLMDNARSISETAVNTGRARRPGVMGDLGFKQDYTRAQAEAMNPYISDKLGKEIMDFVNTATGHGPSRGHWLPSKYTTYNAEFADKYAAYALFSPGNINSRVRMMNPSTYIMASPFVRKQYLKAITSVAATWYGFAQLSKLAGAEVSDDMTSADYGKIRLGDFRLDPAAGFQQYLVAYARAFNGGSTSTTTGTFHRFGSGYQAQTQEDLAERFFVNKMNPVAKFAFDYYNASEYNPFHIGDRTLQMFMPLAIQDAIELYKEDPHLLPWMAPVMLGMGSQVYSKGESVGKLLDPEHDWLKTGGGLRDIIPGMDSSYDLAGLPEPE